jgi:hypothetical protein
MSVANKFTVYFNGKKINTFSAYASSPEEARQYVGGYGSNRNDPRVRIVMHKPRKSSERRTNPHHAYDVFLNGKKIDTVFYSHAEPVDDVKRSLVNHDGYDYNIVVRKARRKNPGSKRGDAYKILKKMGFVNVDREAENLKRQGFSPKAAKALASRLGPARKKNPHGDDAWRRARTRYVVFSRSANSFEQMARARRSVLARVEGDIEARRLCDHFNGTLTARQKARGMKYEFQNERDFDAR